MNKSHWLCIAIGFFAAMLLINKIPEKWEARALDQCRKQLDIDHQVARDSVAVMNAYDQAMSQCSYVVGQHITILSAARELEFDDRGTSRTLEERYAYNIKNVAEATERLSKAKDEAEAMRKDIKFSEFIFLDLKQH